MRKYFFAEFQYHGTFEVQHNTNNYIYKLKIVLNVSMFEGVFAYKFSFLFWFTILLYFTAKNRVLHIVLNVVLYYWFESYISDLTSDMLILLFKISRTPDLIPIVSFLLIFYEYFWRLVQSYNMYFVPLLTSDPLFSSQLLSNATYWACLW